MKYLFFDIECSNCFNGVGKMCEFGYVLTDEKFNIIKQDDIPMSPGRGGENRFHLRDRMKQEDISLAYDEEIYYDCEEFPYFYNRIKKLVEDPETILFAWSSDNDIMHLYHSCKRYGYEEFKYTCYDVQKIAGKYLDTKEQLNLKNAYLKIVGKKSIASIQEHLSRDDAIMTMKILEGVCVLEQTNSQELLDKSEYAKDISNEFTNDFYNRKTKSAIKREKHELYKQASVKDEQYIDDSKYIGKRYNVSGEVKTRIDDINTVIDKIHSIDAICVNRLDKTDIFIVYDENNLNKIKESITDKYNGSYVLLNDFIN